jgi:signal transduction histidine kinase
VASERSIGTGRRLVARRASIIVPAMPPQRPFDKTPAGLKASCPRAAHPGGEDSMATDVAHVALHDDRERIVRDAVQTARRLTSSDSAFAAVRNSDGTAYDIAETDRIVEPAFRRLAIRPGRGLGGQVLAEGRSRTVDDYLNESSITSDYLAVVSREGLRGIGCVPVLGPNGTEVLLYVARHDYGSPGQAAVAELEQVSSAASIGLYHAAARARERELAVLRERQALASALHDSVAQSLFAIGLAAQNSRETSDPAIIEEKLREIEVTAAYARSELRTALARVSRAPESVAFEALFEAELRLFERRTGRRVWITRHGEPRDLGRPLEQLLIDSLREGLSNAAKHTVGAIILAHLAYQSASVVLCLQTELGRSAISRLKSRAQSGLAPGSGLSLLRERTERHGGTLDLAFGEDDVAVLRVEVPA